MKVGKYILGFVMSVMTGIVGMTGSPIAVESTVAAEIVFESSFDVFQNGLPRGWNRYGTEATGTIAPVALPNGKTGTLLDVKDAKQGSGLQWRGPAVGGKYYRATLDSSALPRRSQKGAYLQLRFHPYPLKTYRNSAYLHQVPLEDHDANDNITEVVLAAPADATHVSAYIVTAGTAPAVRLRHFVLEAADKPFTPREADPQKKPGALNNFTRDMRIETALVDDGHPTAAIVAPNSPEYRALAEAVNKAIEDKTGTRLPVLDDRELADIDHLPTHVITLGNRDVNRLVSNLYNRFYTILDAKYPGKAGSVVRSVHDPFGKGGGNVITIGGSDLAGDRQAVAVFIGILERYPAGAGMKLGYLAEIALGEGLTPPGDARDVATWDYCRKTGERDPYGWTLLSKNLALFYLTGDEHYAREFVRFAFPDEKAAGELTEYESAFAIANVNNPLAEPYHYNSSMLILHWDLVEEHPFFSGGVREGVIAKLYEQLNRRRNNGDKGLYNIFNEKKTPNKLNDRHWTSEALTVFIAGRYFDKYYSSRDGRDALTAARRQFASLDRYPAMTVGSLFWYNTFLRPAIDYALLDGGHGYIGNPVFSRYIEALTLLADQTPEDWSQEYSGIRLLNQMAYLSNNQAPVDIARLQKDFDHERFRIGQSFHPVNTYPDDYFNDTDGQWRTARFDPRGMADWEPPFDPKRVVEWMSYRNRGKSGRDFALIDGKYESGRNPFHNFALISLTLRGVPLLRGYHNQLHLYRDGLGESKISRFTEITHVGRVGKSAYLTGKHDQFNNHSWVRTLIIRENGFLLAVDDVTPLTDGECSQIIVNYETPDGVASRRTEQGEFELVTRDGESWTMACSRPGLARQIDVSGAAYLHTSGVSSQFNLRYEGVRGETLRFVSVLRPGKPGKVPSAASNEKQIGLYLPHPARIIMEDNDGFMVEEEHHRFGFQVQSMDGLFVANHPVNADYDIRSGQLAIIAEKPTVLEFADGRKENVAPDKEEIYECKVKLNIETIAEQVAGIVAGKAPFNVAGTEMPTLMRRFSLKPGGFVGVRQAIEFNGRPNILVAVDNRALIVDYDGRITHAFEASSRVGAVCIFPDKSMVLVGSMDEKLCAFSLDGRLLWEFASKMPEGIQHEKQWWAKGEMPGVCRIAVAELIRGKPLIFVGGAGTLEILDSDGKLQKRQFQEWGTFEGFTEMPEHGDSPKAMLSWGYMVGHPSVYRYTGKLKREYFDLSKSADGTFMGSFGFGFVGRNHLLRSRLVKGGPELLIGDFNGTINRLMVWDLDGRVLKEADLGFGIRAFGGIPYGKAMLRNTNVRSLVLPDFDGDGNKSIAVAFRRYFVAAFDAELKSMFYTPLPENPMMMTIVPGVNGDRLAVACAGGEIYVIDKSGCLIGQNKVDGCPTLIESDGKTLVVGTERGELHGFEIP